LTKPSTIALEHEETGDDRHYLPVFYLNQWCDKPSPGANHVTVARAQFKIKSERRAQPDFIGRPSSSRGMTLYLPDVTNLPGEDGDELRD
jgi:hypothetical protein